jgi:hypothetical protein
VGLASKNHSASLAIVLLRKKSGPRMAARLHLPNRLCTPVGIQIQVFAVDGKVVDVQCEAGDFTLQRSFPPSDVLPEWNSL